MSSATLEVTVPDLTDVPAPPVVTSEASSTLTSDPYLPSDADVYNYADIGTKYDEDSNIQYWYNMNYTLILTHILQSLVASSSRLSI